MDLLASIEPVNQAHTSESFEAEIAALQRLLGTTFAENADLRKVIERLRSQLDERELVHDAVGIIMGRLDVDQERAHELLQRGAEADESKLRVAAAAVVAARRTPAEIAAATLAEDPEPEFRQSLWS